MNKKLLRIFTIVAAITTISSVSVIASSNKEVKERIQELKDEFNEKRSSLEADGTYRTDTETAKEIKALGVEISDLEEQVKTESEYRQELEDFIDGCKTGLYDTKKEQEECYDEERQKFIDNMEAKLSRIESEMKANDIRNEKILSTKSRINSKNNLIAPPNNSYKELLEQLEDRSDVD